MSDIVQKLWGGLGGVTSSLFFERVTLYDLKVSPVILLERQAIRSGRQVLKFVSDRKPLYAGVDPYVFQSKAPVKRSNQCCRPCRLTPRER